MSTILSNNLLVNGLRTEFADTYQKASNRQNSSLLGLVCDLSVPATNREHDFAYLNAAPHLAYWQRGETIPTDAMDAIQFNVPVYEWARRVPWSKWDRKDDQTQSLIDMARMAGESAALLEERLFFDIITATADNLPAVPNAPDGNSIYANATRYGVSSANLLTGSGMTMVAEILTDYYAAIEQFMSFTDGTRSTVGGSRIGQPLFSPDVIDRGTIIIHAAADTYLFEQAFIQKRQSIGVGDAGNIPVSGSAIDAGTTPSNIVQDASRNVTLWGTSRLATGDWYVFLREPPKKAIFMLDREGVQEFSSLEGDNNGDHTRDTAEEYIQWERRLGAGVAVPYATVKINN